MVQSWKILAHSPSLAHFIQWPVYSGSQIIVAGEGLCKVGQADRWTQQRVNISNNGILRPLNLISIFLMFCVLGTMDVIDSCGQGVYCFQKGHRATNTWKCCTTAHSEGYICIKIAKYVFLKIVSYGCGHTHDTVIWRSEDSYQKSILAFHHAKVGLLFLWLGASRKFPLLSMLLRLQIHAITSCFFCRSWGLNLGLEVCIFNLWAILSAPNSWI